MSQFHIRCKLGQVSQNVLLAGDPNRVGRIAEKFLEGANLVNDHRGLLVYTGSYNGIKVSAATTGMGCPSAAIVVEELANLGAQTFIRVGTCGAIQRHIKVGDLIIPTGAIPLDGTTKRYVTENFAPAPNFDILNALVESAKKLKAKHYLGLICTSDAFYREELDDAAFWSEQNALCFEMECSIIFTITYLRKLRAGAILVSNGNLLTKERMIDNAKVRKAIDLEIKIALEAIKRLSE
ncbi:MAG: nucleoside phosphorylase [Euryarchaeota archaeon]|nr:nucleoside phosphorylase [Euryarchaeota archaeon]